MSRHVRLEPEAILFAIELLAPKGDFHPVAGAAPDLDHVRVIAARLKLSTEATACR